MFTLWCVSLGANLEINFPSRGIVSGQFIVAAVVMVVTEACYWIYLFWNQLHQLDFYRGADKSLARPTSRYILFDGENISFGASLVMHINSTNIPPIMIINRIFENQNLLSLYLVSFLVGLRTYQHLRTHVTCFEIYLTRKIETSPADYTVLTTFRTV